MAAVSFVAVARVGPVYTHLSGVPEAPLGALREVFTVRSKARAFARRRFARRRFAGAAFWDDSVRYLTSAGRLPTGLLAEAADAVEALGGRLRLVDERRPPRRRRPAVPAEMARRAYQANIVDDAVAATRGIVHAATNSGKTEIAIGIAARLGVRALVLVPTADLVAQTAARFAARLPGWRVATVTGAEPLDGGEADVVVANVQALSHRTRKTARLRPLPPWQRGAKARKKGFGSFTAEGKAWLGGFGAVFADECHTASSAAWSRLVERCGAYYRFALSATPFVEAEERNVLLRGLTGEVIGRVTQPFLVSEGVSAQVAVRVLRYEPDRLVEARDHAGQYAEGVVGSSARNAAVAEAVEAEVAAGRRAVVLVERYRHAEEIAARLRSSWQFASGRTRGDRAAQLARFRSGERPVLLATRVLGVGVDIAEIDALFIAAAGKSANATIQRAGRLVRARPDKRRATLYDCRDLGIYAPSVPARRRYLERHFRKRMATYAGEGFEVEDAPPTRTREAR